MGLEGWVGVSQAESLGWDGREAFRWRELLTPMGSGEAWRSSAETPDSALPSRSLGCMTQSDTLTAFELWFPQLRNGHTNSANITGWL